MVSNATRKVQLSQNLRDSLQKPIRTTGGFRDLVQEILRRLEGPTLTVDDDLFERIEHYAYDFGSGGWQSVLRNLLSEIESAPSAQ